MTHNTLRPRLTQGAGMTYRQFIWAMCPNLEMIAPMTDHSFSDPLANAFSRLTAALESRSAVSASSPEERAALSARIDALTAENSDLKASLTEANTREAEIRRRLDAALTQVDAALAED